jgi:Holliday junction resolvase RusA-like endonuclease
VELDREHVLVVYGAPAPKGSLKCIGRKGRHQLVEDAKRTKPWRERVTVGARRLTVSGLSGPLGVEVTLTVDRPAWHYGTGRNAAKLKASAPPYPHKRSTGIGGDVDKLERTILDALEDAGVLTDDAQVVELIGRKTFRDGPGVLPDALDRPGARIRLYPLEETP